VEGEGQDVLLASAGGSLLAPAARCAPPPDTTLAELNSALLREEEGLVAKRGLVTAYAGGGAGGGFNDSQTFTLRITPVRGRGWVGGGGVAAAVGPAAQTKVGFMPCMWRSPAALPPLQELRRTYESTLLAQVEQVRRGSPGGLGYARAQWRGRVLSCAPCQRPLPVFPSQAAMDQRVSHGVVTSALRGPLRPREGALAAARHISAAFAAALDEAERNHAEQVGGRGQGGRAVAPKPPNLIILCLAAPAPNSPTPCPRRRPAQVLVPTYWQRVFRLPPESAAARTLLVHDGHDGFASVLLLGAEARLFAFEALLFCAIDSGLRCAPASAFLVLAAWRALRAARLHWGRANLSRKTLVDGRFLI
jgi:hypothetical protein